MTIKKAGIGVSIVLGAYFILSGVCSVYAMETNFASSSPTTSEGYSNFGYAQIGKNFSGDFINFKVEGHAQCIGSLSNNFYGGSLLIYSDQNYFDFVATSTFIQGWYDNVVLSGSNCVAGSSDPHDLSYQLSSTSTLNPDYYYKFVFNSGDESRNWIFRGSPNNNQPGYFHTERYSSPGTATTTFFDIYAVSGSSTLPIPSIVPSFPQENSIFSSFPLNFTGSYYVNTNYTYDKIQFRIISTDLISNWWFQDFDFPITRGATTTYSLNISGLGNGSYRVDYWFINSSLFSDFSSILASTDFSINVSDNPNPSLATGVFGEILGGYSTSSTSSTYYLPECTSDTWYGALGCFIQNGFMSVLKFLFIPSEISTNRWFSLYDDISHKPPIGYYYAYVSPLSDLSGGTTTPTSTLTLAYNSDFDNSFVSFFRLPLQIGLWFLFAVYIIKKLKHYANLT